MPETTANLTIEEIKAQIGFPELIARYGYKVSHDKILCPFHQEKTASFHVYADGGKCWGGCGWHGDIIQFVMDRESVYFGEALKLLCSWFGLTKDMPAKEVTKAHEKPKKERREPVNPEIVEFFHQQLTPERRVWLHEKRLLTDETINYLRIGWRPDLDGYSIPFWKGAPQISEVDIMQFRYAPKDGRKARYISLDNHGFAGLMGRHTLNPDFLVVMVGTLDAVLANQDGIPAVSPNGLTVWHKRLDELKWIVGNVNQLFFVPDNTKSETIESVRLANALGAKIKYLPEMEEGKDYTDYRLTHTAKQFLEEVLGVSTKLFIQDDVHVQTVKDMLDFMVEGNAEKAVELLEILELNEYAGWAVSHKLMCLASEQPEGMKPKQWQELIHELEYERTYKGLADILSAMAKFNALKNGDF